MMVQCECGRRIEVEVHGPIIVASCSDCMKYDYANSWDAFFHQWYGFTDEKE
jgi:hypothetical protein